MSTILVCDGCGKHAPPVHGRFPSSLGPDYAWVALYIEANEDEDQASFCSWACLAATATQRAMERELPSAANWTEPPVAADNGSGADR
jgi:hypothetical protein